MNVGNGALVIHPRGDWSAQRRVAITGAGSADVRFGVPFGLKPDITALPKVPTTEVVV